MGNRTVLLRLAHQFGGMRACTHDDELTTTHSVGEDTTLSQPHTPAHTPAHSQPYIPTHTHTHSGRGHHTVTACGGQPGSRARAHNTHARAHANAHAHAHSRTYAHLRTCMHITHAHITLTHTHTHTDTHTHNNDIQTSQTSHNTFKRQQRHDLTIKHQTRVRNACEQALSSSPLQ